MDSLNPIPHPKSPEVVSDSGKRRRPRTGPQPPEPEELPLPCPRCDSTNTKFCYYNNYNLSQPRHFCKSCRRYWTRGGALRKVPVGGGSRYAAATKRRRKTTATPSPTNTTSGGDSNNATPQTKYADPVVSIPDPGLISGPEQGVLVDPSEGKSGTSDCWWSGGQMDPGLDLLPLSGYGLDLGPGCEDGILDWHVEQVVSGEASRCDTWHMDGGEGGGVAEAGDYFYWPDFAISTPAKALK